MKIGKTIESRPINRIGVIALFFFILFAEMVLGGIFYNQAIRYEGANLKLASLIINGGLIFTKAVIVISLMRLVFYRKAESEEAVPSTWVLTLKDILVIGLIVLLYRMAFDSLIGTWLMGWFGISDDLNWSMQLILGAPLLGYSYIFLTAPLFEEVIYRGIFYEGLRKAGHSFWSAGLFSALLFAVMHLDVVQGVNALLLGLLTAYIYERSQTLVAPILFHVLNNLYVTFCSALIMNLQWLTLPLRLFIMGLSLVLLTFALGRFGKSISQNEKATQS